MKTEENIHCNFCADGIYDKKEETMEVMVRGKSITHTLYKCDSCEGEIMRGEKMNRCHHCGQEFCEKGNSDDICNKCKDSIIAGVEKEYGGVLESYTGPVLNAKLTDEILNEDDMRPQSLTGPVLNQSLTDYISKGTIIRTFDSGGNRLVIGLLSKRPYCEQGFIDVDSKIESNISERIAEIGEVRGVCMVEDKIHLDDIVGHVL